jgi:RNA polymerase sigma factor (sigma-70 family)
VIEKYYRENRKRHVYAINKVVKNYSTAEDIVQDAFLKAVMYFASYDANRSKIGNWFSRILYNTLSDHLRKKSILYSEDCFNDDIIDYEFIIENYSTFSALLDNEENKDIIILFFIKGYKHSEISDITGKSLKQIEYICQKFRKTLRSDGI